MLCVGVDCSLLMVFLPVCLTFIIREDPLILCEGTELPSVVETYCDSFISSSSFVSSFLGFLEVANAASCAYSIQIWRQHPIRFWRCTLKCSARSLLQLVSNWCYWACAKTCSGIGRTERSGRSFDDDRCGLLLKAVHEGYRLDKL